MSDELKIRLRLEAAKWGWEVKRNLTELYDIVGSNKMGSVLVVGPSSWGGIPAATSACPYGGYMLVKNCGPFDTGVLDRTAGEPPFMYSKYIVLATRCHVDNAVYHPFLWLYDGDIALVRTVPNFPDNPDCEYGYLNEYIYARTWLPVAQVTHTCDFQERVAPIADEIEAVGEDFVADGFVIGQTINIDGTGLNDGNHIIEQVSGDTIYIAEGLNAELGATATITTPPNLGGWRNLEVIRFDP